MRIPEAVIAVLPCLVTGPATGQHSHTPLRQVESGWVLEGGEQIADVNVFCARCHEKTPAAERSGEVHRRDHPTGGPYPEGEPAYVPLEELDERIALVGGRLSCLSCHAPSESDHRLSVPADGGALCLACHRR